MHLSDWLPGLPGGFLFRWKPGACIALLLLSMATLVSAAAAEDDERYQIEILVFEQNVSDDTGEYWPTTPLRPDTSAALDTDEAQPGLEAVRADSFELAGIAAAMRRARGYRPLIHKAWRQSVPSSKELSRAVLVQSSRENVDGILRLERGRYLHVELDLLFGNGAIADRFTDSARIPYSERPSGYRLQERRRVRNNEIHYFDHPRFGALVLVRPAE